MQAGVRLGARRAIAVAAVLVVMSGCADDADDAEPQPAPVEESGTSAGDEDQPAEPTVATTAEPTVATTAEPTVGTTDDGLLESDYEILATRMIEGVDYVPPDSEIPFETCVMNGMDDGWVMDLDDSLGVPHLGLGEAGVYKSSTGSISLFCGWYHYDEGFGISIAIGDDGFLDREIEDLNGDDGPPSTGQLDGVDYWVEAPGESSYQDFVGSTRRGPLNFHISATSTLLNPEGVAAAFATSVDEIVGQLRLQY